MPRGAGRDRIDRDQERLLGRSWPGAICGRPPLARVVVRILDAIACGHRSSLRVRSHTTASQDGIRDARSEHASGVGTPVAGWPAKGRRCATECDTWSASTWPSPSPRRPAASSGCSSCWPKTGDGVKTPQGPAQASGLGPCTPNALSGNHPPHLRRRPATGKRPKITNPSRAGPFSAACWPQRFTDAAELGVAYTGQILGIVSQKT